jgi:isopentenyl-diphosphate delta-isomerase
VTPAPSEVEDVRWVDLYDLKAEVLRAPDRFTPWLRIYLSDHLDRIFGERMMTVR